MKHKPCLLFFYFIICVPFFIQAQIQLGNDIDGVAANDWAGEKVSISANGNRLAVPSKFNTNAAGQYAGHVRIFEWNGSQWIQMGTSINGEAANDNSGSSVSLSADGSIVAIGAIGSSATGAGAGHTRVYSWSGSAWIQKGADIDGEAAGNNAGGSVSLSADGNTVAIGAVYNNGGGTNSGHARVYSWVNNNWIQLGSDFDGERPNEFWGWRVKLSADGIRLAISTYANTNITTATTGRVKIFSWNGSVWADISGNILGESSFDNFGYDLSISGDGNTIAVGAPRNSVNGTGTAIGSARVYNWNGSAWNQKGTDLDGSVIFDNFGRSLDLSYDGNKVVIASNGRSNTISQSGLLLQYIWNGTSWVQNGNGMFGEAVNDQLGFSTAMSQDGNRVAGGTGQNDGGGTNAGHVRIFEFASILPVNFISFTAYKSDINKVSIQWETYGDDRKEFYEIEKSLNGTSWNIIAKIQATQIIASQKKYNIVDDNDYSVAAYYRLKQVDQNNNITYSNIVKINAEAGNKLVVSPNPTRGVVALQSKTLLQNATLSVYDVSGKKVLAQKLFWNNIDISHLPAGLYVFSLQLGNEVIKEKVIKYE